LTRSTQSYFDSDGLLLLNPANRFSCKINQHLCDIEFYGGNILAQFNGTRTKNFIRTPTGRD
jgi:hypothetical protein